MTLLFKLSRTDKTFLGTVLDWHCNKC